MSPATESDFAGRVVLVTGGTKGVGRAVVAEFARRGAHVIANYFHSQQAAEALREEIRQTGGTVELVRGSVAKPGDVEAMIRTVHEHHGRLDALVNCAARGVFESSEVLTEHDWHRCFEVNLHGPRRCAWAALPLLSRSRGAIVNVSSLGASLAVANYAAVGVSKAALEGLTRYLAADFGPRGVRVNSASAGFLESRTMDLFPDREQLLQTSREASPLGRLGTEAELAQVVVFLASPAASWITGQCLLADGGLSLGRAMLRGDNPPPTKAPSRQPATPHPDGTVALGSSPTTHTAATGVKASAMPAAPTPNPGTRVTSSPQQPAGTIPPPEPAAAAPTHVHRPARVAPTTCHSGAVAVVGMGLEVPGAASPDALWALLRGDRPVFAEPGGRFALADFWDPDPRAEDRTYSRTLGFVRGEEPFSPSQSGAEGDLAARWLRHSIVQATAPLTVPRDKPVSCFVGACTDGNQHFEEALVVEHAVRRIAAHWPGEEPTGQLTERLRDLLRAGYPFDDGRARAHLPHSVVRSATAGLVPTHTRHTVVDTACSSSLYAIDLAAKALLAEECELALAGGYYMVTPRLSVLFSRLGGLSHTGDVRPFDARADGTLFSDGAAVLALKRLEDARRDGDQIHALLAGFGAAADGRGKSIYAPNPRGQELALRRARDVNAVRPEDVGWIVAHGTGTQAGDLVELGTLHDAARGATTASDRTPVCTSNKSLIGHTGWAAGAVSVIHAALGLRHGLVPAQRRFDRLPPDAPAGRVIIPLQDTPFPDPGRGTDRIVGVSGFGFGGTNGHQLLRRDPGPGAAAPHAGRPDREGELVLIAWSALLPGMPNRKDTEARLRSGAPPASARSFEDLSSLASAHGLRLPPRTLAAVDRTHLMALLSADLFTAEHGPIWQGTEETTGVIAAHTGPPAGFGTAALRCYAQSLTELPRRRLDIDSGLHRDDLHTAVRAAVHELRRTTAATSENTQPGIMPNVVPSRISNQLGLNGPVLAIDAGLASGLVAVETAGRYLRSGEMDLALALALNGNSTPELATLLRTHEEALAEGALLLALALEPQARAHGWPVLCRLDITPPDPDSRPPAPHGTDRRPSYLAADGVIDLLSAVLRTDDTSTTQVTGPHPAPVITVRPPSAPDSKAVAEPEAVPEQTTRRYAETLVAEPLAPTAGADAHRPDTTTTPPGKPGTTLLLVDAAAPADAAAALRPADRVVTVGPDDTPEAVVERAFRDGAEDVRHLRVVASWHQNRRWPKAPDRSLLTLQEAMFLIAQRGRDRIADHGTLGILLLDPMPQGTPHPHTALFTGFAKSLSWEWPQARLAALVTDLPPQDAATQLAAEIREYDGSPSVVHRTGTRYRHRLHTSPPRSSANEREYRLAPGSVVLATGGARGITAAVLKGLAHATPIKVWLIGSSSLDDVPDSLLRAPDNELKALRAAHIKRGLHGPDRPTPARLSRDFDRLLRARESQLTLHALRQLCGPTGAHYLTCDVTDPASVAAATRTILDTDPEIELFLNGAGLHNAGNIDQKDLAGFRRIRDVKLLAYHHWKTALAAAPPHRWCNFGSVTGLVGLPGETDYAPANDFYSAAAQYEAGARGHDEFTIAWTVWAETGMGSSDLLQAFNSRNQRMTPLNPPEGAAHFVAESAARPTNEPVVTFVGEAEKQSFGGHFPHYFSPALPPPDGHFLGVPTRRSADSAVWTLTLNREGYLDGHLVGGAPTMPGTFLAEIAAEAARYLAPSASPTTLENLQFRAFVRPGGRAPHHVHAQRATTDNGSNAVHVRITSDVISPHGLLLRPDRELFRATVLLDDEPTENHDPALTQPWDAHDGLPTTDPYYLSDSPVALSGVLRATCRWRDMPHGTSALWCPDPTTLPAALTGFTLPSVLLDSLARCQALRPRPDGTTEVAVPRALRRLEIHCAANDPVLAARHPEGIELRWDSRTSDHVALSPEGRLLARLSGMSVIPMTTRTNTARRTTNNQRPAPDHRRHGRTP
ncbi:SDR family oxidoreductase [Streptomyces sp. NPDC090442]|uniref:SDR family oxidoreductase n=1 Tax=Streptomyces sp. NPDC090442 TaxID=3365962 RepID=UPI0038258139